MNDRTNLFRKFLTTASVIGLVSLSSNALGDITTTANPAPVSNNGGGKWNPNRAVVNGDNIIVGATDANGNALIQVDVNNLTVTSHDLNNKAGSTVVAVPANFNYTAGSIGGAGNGGFVFRQEAGSTVTLNGAAGGNIAASDYSKLTDWFFGPNGNSTLNLNIPTVGAKAPALPTRFSLINLGNGVVNVVSSVTLTDNGSTNAGFISTGLIGRVNIGNGQTYGISPAVRTTNNAVVLNKVGLAGNSINFGNAASKLELSSVDGAHNDFALINDISAPNGGVISLSSNGVTAGRVGSIASLITNDNTPKNIGTVANKFTAFNVTGEGISLIGPYVNIHANEFNVKPGSIVKVFNGSIADVNNVTTINIGENTGLQNIGGAALWFDGKVLIDGQNVPADATMTISASNIRFNHADSTLILNQSSTNNHSMTYKLAGDIAGMNGAGANGGGLISLLSGDTGSLIIASDIPNTIRRIGAANGNKIQVVGANGSQPITITKDIDLSGVASLRINNNSKLTVESSTISKVANVRVGTNTGAAHLTLDGASEIASGNNGQGADVQVDLDGNKLHLNNFESNISIGGVINSAHNLIYTLINGIDNTANGVGEINLYLNKNGNDSVAGSALILAGNDLNGNSVPLFQQRGGIVNLTGSKNTNNLIIARTIDLSGTSILSVKENEAQVRTKTIENIGSIIIGSSASGVNPGKKATLYISGTDEVAHTRLAKANAGGNNYQAQKGDGNTTFNVPANGIKFSTFDSELALGGDLASEDILTFALSGDLKAFPGNGGVLHLYSTMRTPGSRVVLDSSDATVRKLGNVNGDKLSLVKATGSGFSIISKNIDLAGVDKISSSEEKTVLVLQTNKFNPNTQFSVGAAGQGEGSYIAFAPAADKDVNGNIVQLSTDIYGDKIKFEDTNSQILLVSELGAKNNFNLKTDLNPGAANTGVVVISSVGIDNNNVSALSLNSDAPVSMGDSVNTLKKVIIYNQNNSLPIGHQISINTEELDIINGSNVILSNPATKAGVIKVGTAYDGLGVANVGDASLTLDATSAALTAGGNVEFSVDRIELESTKSSVNFSGIVADDNTTTFQLRGDIINLSAGGVTGGIVNINSTGSGTDGKLVIASDQASKAGGLTATGVATTANTNGVTRNVGLVTVNSGNIEELNIAGEAPVVITRDIDLSAVENVYLLGGNPTLEVQNNSLFIRENSKVQIGVPGVVGANNPSAATLVFNATEEVAFKRGSEEYANGAPVAVAPGQGNVTMAINNADKITFSASDSTFALGAVIKEQDIVTFQLGKNIKGLANGGGRIELFTSRDGLNSNAKSSLVLTSKTDQKVLLGDVGNKISELEVDGSAPITITNSVSIANVEAVYINGKLIVQTGTVNDVDTIDINAGTLVLDASKENINFARGADTGQNQRAAQEINFLSNNSRIVITNSNGNDNNVVNLGSNLNPGNGKGIIEFNSVGAGELFLSGGSIGAQDPQSNTISIVKEFAVTGTKAGTVDSKIYAQTISIGDAGNAATDVIGATVFNKAVDASEIKFNKPGNILIADNSAINHLDFNGNVANTSLTIANGMKLVIGREFAGTTQLSNQIKFGDGATLVIQNNSEEDEHIIDLHDNLSTNAGANVNRGSIIISTDLNCNTNIISSAEDRNMSLGTNDHRLENITIEGKGITGLGVDIFADKTILTNTNIKLLRDIKIVNNKANAASAVIRDSKVDLSNNKLEYTGQVSMIGDNIFVTRYGTDAETYSSADQKGGNIKVANGSKIAFAPKSTLTLDFSAPTLQGDALADIMKSGTVSYDVISGEAADAVEGDPTINGFTLAAQTDAAPNEKNPNRFISWTNVDGTIIGTYKPEVLKEDAAKNPDLVPTVEEVSESRKDIKAGRGDDADYYNDTYMNLSNFSEAATKDYTDRLQPSATNNKAMIETTHAAMQAGTSAVLSSIGQRMASFSKAAMPARAAEAHQGIAAGDESLRHGIWGSPFVNQAVQKKLGESAGYRMQSSGATVGFDTMLNDDLTAGVAVTMFHTNIKHKDQKANDRTRVDTYMGSLYMLNEMQNSMFVQGVASFGTSNVRNNEHRRTGIAATEIANGKYESTSWGGEVLLGYNGKKDNIFFSPMAGLRYSRFNDNGYKETGTTHHNLSVSKRAIDKLEGVIGGRVSMEAKLMDVSVTPEIHGFLNYDMMGKKPRIEGRLDGRAKAFKTKTSKPTRAFFNIGAGIGTNYRMMDYNFVYDATIARKFVGHTGALRVRVNF